MRTGIVVLVALLLSGAAAAQEDATPSAREPEAASPAPSPAHYRLPSPETFRLFTGIAPGPRIDLEGRPDGQRLFHQSGDPDSLFTIGAPTPGGELHLKAAIEVNEIFLKAIPPDPLVQPNDTRPRAAGSFLPLDNGGRPYQLRLGARLVW